MRIKKRLKINGILLLLTMLVFALLIKLGLWQLSRAVEKEQRMTQMALFAQQGPLDLTRVNALYLAQQTVNDLRVSLDGFFNNQQVFLLDNQTYQGRLGYRVIQIFDDQLSGLSVLVNLGWVQGSVNRSLLPEVAGIEGRTAFNGLVRLVDAPLVLVKDQLTADLWPQRIQAVDIEQIGNLLNKPLLPFMVYVDNDQALGYQKNWTPIVMPPEKHRAYAFQWFAMALVWLLLMGTAAYQSFRQKI